MTRTRTLLLITTVALLVASLGAQITPGFSNPPTSSGTEVVEEGFSQSLYDQVLGAKTGRTWVSVSQRCSAQGTPLLSISGVDGYVAEVEIVGLDPRTSKELEPLHKDSRWFQYRQVGAAPGQSRLTDYSPSTQSSSKKVTAPASTYSKAMPLDCLPSKAAILAYPFKSLEQITEGVSRGTLADEAGRVWNIRKNGTSLVASYVQDANKVFEVFKEVEKVAATASVTPKNRSILLLRISGAGDQVVQTNEYAFQGGGQVILTGDNRSKHPTPVLSLIWDLPRATP